jgi:hypothetical protein
MVPQSFAAGVSGHCRSLGGGQNRFSYGTMATLAIFGSEIAGLRPPRSRLGILWWCPPCSPEATSEVRSSAGG